MGKASPPPAGIPWFVPAADPSQHLLRSQPIPHLRHSIAPPTMQSPGTSCATVPGLSKFPILQQRTAGSQPCPEDTFSPTRPSSAAGNPKETKTIRAGAVREREAEHGPAALSSARYCCCRGRRVSSTAPCPPLNVILRSEAQRTT